MIEKVVFISDDEYYLGTLTRGKVYDAHYDETEAVYSSTGLYYTITNDIGIKKEYYDGHFVTLDKWRERQIQKIL